MRLELPGLTVNRPSLGRGEPFPRSASLTGQEADQNFTSRSRDPIAICVILSIAFVMVSALAARTSLAEPADLVLSVPSVGQVPSAEGKMPSDQGPRVQDAIPKSEEASTVCDENIGSRRSEMSMLKRFVRVTNVAEEYQCARDSELQSEKELFP